MLAPWKKSYDQPRHTWKSRDIPLPAKVHLVKAMVFPIVIYGCESWTIKKGMSKNWHLNCGFGEDSWEFLDFKEIKPVSPKGNQPWIFIGRTDAEVEVPILWPPEEKSQLIRKDPDAGEDWGQEEKGMTEDEMVGWTWVRHLREMVMDREA